MKHRYYSTQRPVTPGSYPKEGAQYIENYSQPNFFHEINRAAWGYIDYDRELTEEEAKAYELIPEGILWYSVTVASKKHGGGLKAIVDNDTVRAKERPQDKRYETRVREFKSRYFESLEEAERVRDVLNSIEVTTERTRASVTQGECRVFINGTYILNFGDEITLVPKEADKADYYGEDIGGYMSSTPDSSMTLGLIWHPFDYIYNYSELVCNKLGIEPGEWI